MFRRISSSGARRRPSGDLVEGRHIVHVVGAKGERDLRQLGPVQRPIRLDVRDIGQEDSCKRDSLYVFEPVVG